MVLSLGKCISLVAVLAIIVASAISPALAFVSPAVGPDWRGLIGSYRHQTLTRALGVRRGDPAIDLTVELLLHYTNEERRHFRLRELRFNSELALAAQRHADDMAYNGYFSHTGFDGSSLGDRVKMTNYRYNAIAENLFCRSPDNSPFHAVKGWMDSEEHRINVLNGEFSEIGLGYAKYKDCNYYVQVFGAPLKTPSVDGEDTTGCLLHLTNTARAKAKLNSLSLSDELNSVAQKHAEYMAHVDHCTADLPFPSCGFQCTAANVVYCELFNDPHAAFESWLEHDCVGRASILDGRFTKVGLGYATSGERHYYVQLFGTPTSRSGVGGDSDDTFTNQPTGNQFDALQSGGHQFDRQQQENSFGHRRPSQPFRGQLPGNQQPGGQVWGQRPGHPRQPGNHHQF